MTNKELAKACKAELKKLIDSGGQSFTMRIPAEEGKDTDLLFSELLRRFRQMDIALEDVYSMRDAQTRYFASVKEDRATAKAAGMHWRTKPAGSLSADWLRLSKHIEGEVDIKLADLRKHNQEADRKAEGK